MWGKGRNYRTSRREPPGSPHPTSPAGVVHLEPRSAGESPATDLAFPPPTPRFCPDLSGHEWCWIISTNSSSSRAAAPAESVIPSVRGGGPPRGRGHGKGGRGGDWGGRYSPGARKPPAGLACGAAGGPCAIPAAPWLPSAGPRAEQPALMVRFSPPPAHRPRQPRSSGRRRWSPEQLEQLALPKGWRLPTGQTISGRRPGVRAVRRGAGRGRRAWRRLGGPTAEGGSSAPPRARGAWGPEGPTGGQAAFPGRAVGTVLDFPGPLRVCLGPARGSFRARQTEDLATRAPGRCPLLRRWERALARNPAFVPAPAPCGVWGASPAADSAAPHHQRQRAVAGTLQGAPHLYPSISVAQRIKAPAFKARLKVRK